MNYPVERYGFTSKRHDRPFYIQVRDCLPAFATAHVHDALEFGIAVKGSGFFFLNGKAFPMKAGDIYLTYGGFAHAHYGAGFRLIVSHLSIESLFAMRVEGADDLLRPFFNVSCEKNPLLRNRGPLMKPLLKACGQYAHPNPLLKMEACIRTLSVLVTAIRSIKNPKECGPRTVADKTSVLTSAIRFIESSYTQPVTVREIARHVHLSESRFSHLFSEFMNTSPLQFRNRLRVQKAVELLQTGTDKISSIALQCGFNDLSQFNRFFRKTTGRSPGGFRN